MLRCWNPSALERCFTRTHLVVPSAFPLITSREPNLAILFNLRNFAPRTTRRQLASSTSSGLNSKLLDQDLILTKTDSASYLHLNIPSVKTQPLDLVFLRDSCSCSQCVNQFSSQKQFETAAIPLNIGVSAAHRLADGKIRIRWINDVPGFENHTTVLPPSFWQENASEFSRYQAAYEGRDAMPWTRNLIISKESEIYHDFDEYVNSDTTLYTVLRNIDSYGLCFITNVPHDPASVVILSQRIGPLLNSFYGETWDVRARPSAKNVAYTATHLDFHMDLLYMKDPPYLQFLHCIKQSTAGGESLFSDALNAVYRIQVEHTDLAPSMWRFPVTYRYKNEGKYYQYTRPLLEGQDMYDADEVYDRWSRNLASSTDGVLSSTKVGLIWNRNFHAINWAPQFQGPFIKDVGQAVSDSNQESQLRNYLKMSKVFRSITGDARSIYEMKMQEGTCVIFDNRRILHARKAFTAEGGERWLKGSYVDGNSYSSRLRAFKAGMQDMSPTELRD